MPEPDSTAMPVEPSQPAEPQAVEIAEGSSCDAAATPDVVAPTSSTSAAPAPDPGGDGMTEDQRMVAEMAKRGYEVLPVDRDNEADPEDCTSMSKYPNLPIEKCKEKGNQAFKEKKYKRAIAYYTGGLKQVLSALCQGPHMLGNMDLSELDLTLNLNTAQCYICLGEPEMGIMFCDKALKRRDHLKKEHLVKALYRKAMCFGESKTRTKEALEVLEDLLTVDRDCKAAQQYYNTKKREWLLQKKKDSKAMKKMFGAYEQEGKELTQQELERKRVLLRDFFAPGIVQAGSLKNAPPRTVAGDNSDVHALLSKNESQTAPGGAVSSSSSSPSRSTTSSSRIPEIEKEFNEAPFFKNLDQNFLYTFSDTSSELFSPLLPSVSTKQQPAVSITPLKGEGDGDHEDVPVAHPRSAAGDEEDEEVAGCSAADVDSKTTDKTTEEKNTTTEAVDEPPPVPPELLKQHRENIAGGVPGAKIDPSSPPPGGTTSSSSSASTNPNHDALRELAAATKMLAPPDLAKTCQQIKSLDRNQWPCQLRDTCIFALLNYALLSNPDDKDFHPLVNQEPTGQRDIEFWFFGASGTFELQFQDPNLWIQAFGPLKRIIRLVNVGFLGERTPDDDVIEDKAKPENDGIWKSVSGKNGGGTCVIENYNMPAEDALNTVLKDRKPGMIFFLQPYLHRYVSRWWETFQLLIEKKYPYAIVGGSEPDYSWEQDQKILETMGARVLLGATKSPYPMQMKGAAKCHHILLARGGVGRRGLTPMQAKVELLTNDVHLVGK